MTSPVEVGRLWAIVRRVSAWSFRAAWLSTMIITPLFGAWLASAMAA